MWGRRYYYIPIQQTDLSRLQVTQLVSSNLGSLTVGWLITITLKAVLKLEGNSLLKENRCQ